MQLIRKPFLFLRHGETDWNRERRLQGQTDVPLNATGEAQAGDARDRLANAPVATVCCSPLSRARRTAEIVNQALACPLVVIDDLGECGFGAHEGRLVSGGAYEDWLRDAGAAGGESYDDFAGRALAAINQALGHPGPVLIVAHGGVFRVLDTLAGLGREGMAANAAPLRLEPSGGDGRAWTATAL